MKIFKSLPEDVYLVRTKNPKKFQEWLHRYGCNLSIEPTGARAKGKDFYIMTGNLYGYFIERWDSPPAEVLTPKQFKKLVREVVGEPE